MAGRRRILETAVVGLSGIGLAGCFGDDGPDENEDAVHLCRLEVSNRDDSSHDVSLRVMDGEQERYARDDEVEAGHEDFASGFSVPPAELPNEPGSYLVRARLNDDWRELYVPDVGRDQVAVLSMILPNGDQPRLELWHSSEPDSCA